MEPLYDIMNDLNTGSEDEETPELNRAMSVGELRKAIESEATDPETIDDDDFRELIDGLLTDYGNVLVNVFNEEEQHFGIVDRNENKVKPMTLDHMGQANYKLIEAGVRDYEYKDGNAYQHAFAEFRPRN